MARRTSLDKLASQRNQAEKQFKSLNERFKGMSEQQKKQNPEYVSARSQYHQALSRFANKGPGGSLRAAKSGYTRTKGFFPYEK